MEKLTIWVGVVVGNDEGLFDIAVIPDPSDPEVEDLCGLRMEEVAAAADRLLPHLDRSQRLRKLREGAEVSTTEWRRLIEERKH